MFSQHIKTRDYLWLQPSFRWFGSDNKHKIVRKYIPSELGNMPKGSMACGKTCYNEKSLVRCGGVVGTSFLERSWSYSQLLSYSSVIKGEALARQAARIGKFLVMCLKCNPKWYVFPVASRDASQPSAETQNQSCCWCLRSFQKKIY